MYCILMLFFQLIDQLVYYNINFDCHYNYYYTYEVQWDQLSVSPYLLIWSHTVQLCIKRPISKGHLQ